MLDEHSSRRRTAQGYHGAAGRHMWLAGRRPPPNPRTVSDMLAAAAGAHPPSDQRSYLLIACRAGQAAVATWPAPACSAAPPPLLHQPVGRRRALGAARGFFNHASSDQAAQLGAHSSFRDLQGAARPKDARCRQGAVVPCRAHSWRRETAPPPRVGVLGPLQLVATCALTENMHRTMR